jgi:endonuclease/exonuclease/phosphatase family metal-dependent hydrolase
MRLATWNIGGRESLEDLTATIEGLNADILLLQECDRFAARSGCLDYADSLAEQLDLQAVFAPTLRLPAECAGTREREYGNLILLSSEVSVTSTEAIALRVPPTPGEPVQRSLYEPRNITIAHTPGLIVASIHLAGPPREGRPHPILLQQLSECMRWLQTQHTPAIIGGDWNLSPGALSRMSQDAVRPPKPGIWAPSDATWRSGLVLDYFVGHGASARIHESVSTSWASVPTHMDHRPTVLVVAP